MPTARAACACARAELSGRAILVTPWKPARRDERLWGAVPLSRGCLHGLFARWCPATRDCRSRRSVSLHQPGSLMGNGSVSRLVCHLNGFCGAEIRASTPRRRRTATRASLWRWGRPKDVLVVRWAAHPRLRGASRDLGHGRRWKRPATIDPKLRGRRAGHGHPTGDGSRSHGSTSTSVEKGRDLRLELGWQRSAQDCAWVRSFVSNPGAEPEGVRITRPRKPMRARRCMHRYRTSASPQSRCPSRIAVARAYGIVRQIGCVPAGSAHHIDIPVVVADTGKDKASSIGTPSDVDVERSRAAGEIAMLRPVGSDRMNVRPEKRRLLELVKGVHRPVGDQRGDCSS